MNTRHYYLRLLRTLALAALTAAATAACSDDNGDPDGREPITPDDANPGIAVNFTANINPGSDANPAAAPGTRTVLKPDGRNGFTVEWKGQDTYPSDCDEISIWAVKGTTKIGPKTYMPLTSGASSVLVPKDDSQKLTLTETGEWKFTAVYGTNSFVGSDPTFELRSLSPQTAPGNTNHIASWDFSVATATKTVDANSDMPQDISLRFEHKLSALQLHVTNQTGEELTIRKIRLSADGDQIAYSRNYDIATGDWYTTGEAKRGHLELDMAFAAALASDGTAQDFHMLFFPGYENTNMTVTVITSRGEYSRTRSAPDGGFLAGKNYLTNIVIKTDGLDPAEEKWEEYITNKAELIAFRDKVNNGNTYDGKTVRLTADIDLANETWTTPIGTDALNSFNGTFDGGGHHISKLSVDNGSNGYAGLFGYVYKGTVRNLRVSGTVTTTGYNAGGIAGYLSGSTVENCIFDGTVSAGSDVGGIAGYSRTNSRIAGCHTKGTVTATATFSQAAGGIAGKNVGSTIDGCYSEAEVTTNYQSAGGIAGSNESGGTITHCYATGKVSGKNAVGGIVGFNDNSTLTGCIALNPGLTRTEGNYTDFGQVVGNNQGTSTPTSCAAYDGMTITDNASQPITGTGEAGTALPAADCLTPAAYTSRDFPEATATTPGWAFDATTPWTYLPWNKAFESFHNISETDYRISVPAYLSGGGTN